jgi:transketolase
VSEALAAAGTASLRNAILHLDWNQASIDSNRVCRVGETPGDYVQWNPMELFYLHDWNVIYVPQGMNFQQIVAAQHRAAGVKNGQPTVIVYRTTKGWKYGIEGKGSHGAGHSLCSDGFFAALRPLTKGKALSLPRCQGEQRCRAGKESDVLERCLWEALTGIRMVLENSPDLVKAMAERVVRARERLNARKRQPRKNAPQVNIAYVTAQKEARTIPDSLRLAPGASTTLRGELGRVLEHYNKLTRGAVFVAAADQLGSTSVNVGAKGFPEGYFNGTTNPEARTLSLGGICEDAMAGILAGIATFGHHIGVASSYGAFIAALSHIASRLHAIGNQARQSVVKEPYKPIVITCAHAGVKTGEDGPTHADPQPLQLLQENFPRGTLITLTPWDPQEMWTAFSAALARRPAVIAPFVTRPTEKVIDRKALGLAPATACAKGIYLLKAAEGKRSDGTLVLQGSEVGYAFVEETLPLLKQKGIDLDVYYVASAELFDLLSPAEQERIFPARLGEKALGMTGFTLPTMYRWIRSERGRRMTLHPFKKGHFLGSGQAHMVMKEAGLNGEGQIKAILQYLK